MFTAIYYSALSDLNIPFIHKMAAILQRVHLRDIELENIVNEVAYKVISLINMTHTKRHMYTQIQVSRF